MSHITKGKTTRKVEFTKISNCLNNICNLIQTMYTLNLQIKPLVSSTPSPPDDIPGSEAATPIIHALYSTVHWFLESLQIRLLLLMKLECFLSHAVCFLVSSSTLFSLSTGLLSQPISLSCSVTHSERLYHDHLRLSTDFVTCSFPPFSTASGWNLRWWSFCLSLCRVSSCVSMRWLGVHCRGSWVCVRCYISL